MGLFDNTTTSSGVVYNSGPTFVVFVAVILIYSLIFLTSTVGNSLVCYVVQRNPSMHNNINYLLVNQAVADLLISFSSLYFILLDAAVDAIKGSLSCKIDGFCFFVFHRVSILTLVAIAHDRHRAICKPLTNMRRRCSFKLTISVIWLFSTLSQIPLALYCGIVVKDNEMKCVCLELFPSTETRVVYTCLYFLINYVGPVTIIANCYIAIVLKLRHRPPGQSGGTDSIYQARKSIIKMLVVSFLVFFTSWTPIYLIYILEATPVNIETIYPYVWYPSLLLGFLNSAWNPIIYCFLSTNYRDGFKAALCFRCRHHAMPPSNRRTLTWRRNLVRERTAN